MSTPSLTGLPLDFYNLIVRIDRGDRVARHQIDRQKKRNAAGDMAFQQAVEAFVKEHQRVCLNYDEQRGTFASALKRLGVVPTPPTMAPSAAPSALASAGVSSPGAASGMRLGVLPVVADALDKGSLNHPFAKLAQSWAGMAQDDRDFELARAVDTLGVSVGREQLALILDAWLVRHFPAPPSEEAEAETQAEAAPTPTVTTELVPAAPPKPPSAAAVKKAKAEAAEKAKAEAEAAEKAKAEAEAAEKAKAEAEAAEKAKSADGTRS